VRPTGEGDGLPCALAALGQRPVGLVGWPPDADAALTDDAVASDGTRARRRAPGGHEGGGGAWVLYILFEYM
jgi:hypothetical protein